MKGIDELAEKFLTNQNVCEEPKELNQGDKCFILDTEIINAESDFYAIIPVTVVAVDSRPSRFNRKYYWFRAEGSKLDDQLNSKQEEYMGTTIEYYKYLESTSPYILLSEPAED